MKYIKLTRGFYATVDDDDFIKYRNIKWHALGGGRYVYAANGISVNGMRQSILLHRVIMDAPGDMVVDHINHDTLDNRKINLRICTRIENTRNRINANAGSESRERGVSYHRGRWQSRIRVNGSEIYLGIYVDKNDASRAYWSANRKYFGQYGGR